MKVAVHYEPQSTRSKHIAKAMARGIEACGDTSQLYERLVVIPEADVGILYGWRRPDLFEAYRAAGKAFVHIDLGWWNRKPTGVPLEGFHKVVINGRDDVPERKAPPDRFLAQKVPIRPWRTKGRPILLAGMSEKSAGTRGFGPEEWEVGAIDQIRTHTPRPIIYRPKPSWTRATFLNHTKTGADVDLDGLLKQMWAVVACHSNVAVDALCAGVPVHVEGGAALRLSCRLAQIDNPPLPKGREQLMADIAYSQWSVPEMRSGECWRFMRTEIPPCG